MKVTSEVLSDYGAKMVERYKAINREYYVPIAVSVVDKFERINEPSQLSLHIIGKDYIFRNSCKVGGEYYFLANTISIANICMVLNHRDSPLYIAYVLCHEIGHSVHHYVSCNDVTNGFFYNSIIKELAFNFMRYLTAHYFEAVSIMKPYFGSITEKWIDRWLYSSVRVNEIFADMFAWYVIDVNNVTTLDEVFLDSLRVFDLFFDEKEQRWNAIEELMNGLGIGNFVYRNPAFYEKLFYDCWYVIKEEGIDVWKKV